MADPDEPNPADPPAVQESRPHRARHTGAQRAVLAVNVLVVVLCFAGAAALIVGKRVRESFVAAPKVTYPDVSTTSVVAPTTAATTPAAGSETPTSVAAASSTAPTETFPDPDPTAM